MSAATMGRPKKPKPVEAGPKPTALTIKGSLEWRAWVDGLAKYRRTDVAKVVDAALIEYAINHGYKPSPPDR